MMNLAMRHAAHDQPPCSRKRKPLLEKAILEINAQDSPYLAHEIPGQPPAPPPKAHPTPSSRQCLLLGIARLMIQDKMRC